MIEQFLYPQRKSFDKKSFEKHTLRFLKSKLFWLSFFIRSKPEFLQRLRRHWLL